MQRPAYLAALVALALTATGGVGWLILDALGENAPRPSASRPSVRIGSATTLTGAGPDNRLAVVESKEIAPASPTPEPGESDEHVAEEALLPPILDDSMDHGFWLEILGQARADLDRIKDRPTPSDARILVQVSASSVTAILEAQGRYRDVGPDERVSIPMPDPGDGEFKIFGRGRVYQGRCTEFPEYPILLGILAGTGQSSVDQDNELLAQVLVELIPHVQERLDTATALVE